jgi:class 3 adenylate cyclase
MQELSATESSVLVDDPDPESDYLVFLVAHGPAAAKIEKIKVPFDSIAGKVFRQGSPVIGDPHRDPNFSPMVDSRAQHLTRNMLTVPLYHRRGIVGVAQFLNKQNGAEFTREDEHSTVAAVTRVAVKVGDFVGELEHFAEVGLYSPPSPYRAATVFCDLSHSSSLFDTLREPNAVACINEYLSQVTEIVLNAGGVIDRYLGDGAMFRFVDASPVGGNGRNATVNSAATAALRAVDDFVRLKESWLKHSWDVQRVYSRMGISYGPYREVLLGPVRHRERLVVGASVHRAGQICELASRDRNIVVVDRETSGLLGENWKLSEHVSSRLAEGFFEIEER